MDVRHCILKYSQQTKSSQEPTCVSLFPMSFRHRLRLLFVSGPEANRNAPERGKRGERSENTKWGPLRLGPTPNKYEEDIDGLIFFMIIQHYSVSLSSIIIHDILSIIIQDV